MSILVLISMALFLEPLLEKVYQHLFLYQPVYFKLDAGKSYHAFTAKERLTRFHHIRQAVFMYVGILLLIILTGKEIFEGGNFLQKGCFLGSLTCILIPLCEMAYYRWSTGRHYKTGMTAKEMSVYHDYCEKYYRHPYALNGECRKRLRFILLSFGIELLMTLAFFTLIP